MNRVQLRIDLLKLEATGGRHFNGQAYCKPVRTDDDVQGAENDVEDDSDDDDAQEAGADAVDKDGLPLDMYSVFDRERPTVFAPEFDGLMDRQWDKEYKNTFEEECRVKDTDMDQRVKEYDAPCVMARGTPPRDYMCWCCGKQAANDVQMPDEVYATAYCVAGPNEAIRSLASFAQLLADGNFDEAIRRTAVCRQTRCMIAQHKLTSESYATWYWSRDANGVRRPQLEKGTDRKDQGVVFADNVLLMRWLVMQPSKPISDKQIAALFLWLVVNSQFVQEREKRFIATAMAILDSATFPYKFSDQQSFVDKMSSLPRNYIEKVILAHILDLSLEDNDRWISWGNRLLETAFPKAADAAFMIACLDNWEQQGRPLDADGRPEHRVRNDKPELKTFFTVKGFGDAVTKAHEAAHAKGTEHEHGYKLFYASAPPTKSSVKMGKNQTRRDTQQLLKALTGSNKRAYTRAKGVRAKNAQPTCGSFQADSGVHTKQRYEGIAAALGLKDGETKLAVSLFVDTWEQGNSVGKEKLQGKKADRTKAKACSSIRLPKEFDPRCLTAATAHKRAKKIEACDTMVAIKKRAVGFGARSSS
jgi:hypothetical protein